MRRVLPRSRERHELTASEVLEGYARRFGWVPRLPVPIEQIVEVQVGLRVVWAELAEEAGEAVLGALDPVTRTVYLNERHQHMYERWIGPYEFTLAHELGHWVYDAVPPSQQRLVAVDGSEVFCRKPGVDRSANGLREVNANRFAACLLLPRSLVRPLLTQPFASTRDLADTARSWGVSRRTLEIRLAELSLSGFLPSDLLRHNTTSG